MAYSAYVHYQCLVNVLMISRLNCDGIDSSWQPDRIPAMHGTFVNHLEWNRSPEIDAGIFPFLLVHSFNGTSASCRVDSHVSTAVAAGEQEQLVQVV